MKKLFLTALGLFAVTLVFSLSASEKSIELNSAFADGTCCKERSSVCGLNGDNYRNKYLKSSSGSCGGAGDEIDIAFE